MTACSRDEQTADPAGAAPSPTPTEASRESGGVLYAFAREPRAIDPAFAVDPDDLLISSQLFDSLPATGPHGDVLPSAAERWETDEAGEPGAVWTFHLRPDARFHDGSPVTAASFVGAWERVADRTGDDGSPSHHLLEGIRGIEEARQGGPLRGAEAIDDLTLRVTLDEPSLEFPVLVSHPALAPIPEVATTETDFGRMPVGNGPFRMAEPWQPNQYIRLERSDEHPADTSLDQVVFRIYGGDDALETAFEDLVRGSLDVAPVPDGRREQVVESLGRSPDGRSGPGLINGLRSTAVFYAFNVEAAPFDERDVRRAIASLIDREALLDVEGGGSRVAARSVVPPPVAAGEVATCAYCEQDVELALELLAERDLGEIELVTHDGGEHPEVAARVALAVNRVLGTGTMTVRVVTQEEWVETVRSGEAALFLSGWSPEYPSPGAYLAPLFHPDEVGGDNVSRYRSSEVGELLDRARVTEDEGERAELYRRAEEHVLDDAVVIPLAFYRHGTAVSERTRGFTLPPSGLADLAAVELAGE